MTKFGIVTRTVDLDADSSNDLFAAGVQALQQNSLMVTSYTIRAVDLVDAGYSTERLTFACYAHILSAPHSVDAIMLCSKMVEPLDHPEKKEYTFGMTRRTLTDRQVENLGRTNLLDESASAAERYSQNTINQLFAYKKQTDEKISDISGGLTNAVEKMGDLQNQIDDNITSWFYAGVPTASNAPAKSWTTETVKKQHIGDLYYDKDSGIGYRWVLDGSAYKWQVIRDTGVAKALADAAGAQAAADSKVRCFVRQPSPPYDVGDIWMGGSGGDIKRCQTARQTGSYNAADWVLGSKYTDDTAANKAQGAADKAQSSANNAQNTADQAKKDAAEAAKTATNFITFDETSGMIVGHKNLAGKKVQITNDGVKVMDGNCMVSIRSNGISITDGSGSCSIDSGKITFHGIKNNTELFKNDATTYAAQTYTVDLSAYSAILVTFRSNKGGTWFAGGGNAGLVSMIVPVNGVEMSMVYPWNTVHRRSITAYSDRIVFGTGYQRTSNYNLGIVNYFDLETPFSDGWKEDNTKCIPYRVYGFM